MPQLNDAQREAVETADAHLNDAALPSYTELASLLLMFREAAQASLDSLRPLAVHPSHYKPMADVLAHANELLGGE